MNRQEARLNDMSAEMFAELSRLRRELMAPLGREEFVKAVLNFMCKENPKLVKIRRRVEAGLCSRLATLDKKAS